MRPRDKAAAWKDIRALRHQPPGYAKRGDRRKTFAAAMKQSQELFETADDLTYETKPLLLYYGLTQATTALATAMLNPKTFDGITGHGLRCPNLKQNPPEPGDVQVEPNGISGTFQALAEILESPTLPGVVNLRDLWVSIPEGSQVPLAGSGNLWSAAKIATDEAESGDGRTWKGRFMSSPFFPKQKKAEEVQALLIARYPYLDKLKLRVSQKRRIRLGPKAGLRSVLALERSDDGRTFESLMTGFNVARAKGYPTDDALGWYIPCLEGNTKPMHPLLVWCAILYALSMLARYHPLSWARMLNVDESRDATAIEYMLDEVHQACVLLIRLALEGLQYEEGVNVIVFNE